MTCSCHSLSLLFLSLSRSLARSLASVVAASFIRSVCTHTQVSTGATARIGAFVNVSDVDAVPSGGAADFLSVAVLAAAPTLRFAQVGANVRVSSGGSGADGTFSAFVTVAGPTVMRAGLH